MAVLKGKDRGYTVGIPGCPVGFAESYTGRIGAPCGLVAVPMRLHRMGVYIVGLTIIGAKIRN